MALFKAGLCMDTFTGILAFCAVSSIRSGIRNLGSKSDYAMEMKNRKRLYRDKSLISALPVKSMVRSNYYTLVSILSTPSQSCIGWVMGV